jgi:hypothetical protein
MPENQSPENKPGEGQGSPARRRFQAFCGEMKIPGYRMACRMDSDEQFKSDRIVVNLWFRGLALGRK